MIPLLIAGLAMSAASTGMSIYGGMAAKRQAKHQAEAMKRAAQRAREFARAEADQIRMKQPKYLGAQKTGYAYAGVSMEGTPSVVAGYTASEIEREAQKEILKGEYNALNLESGASVAYQQGNAYMTQGIAGGIASAAQGLSSAYSMYKSSTAPVTSGAFDKGTA